MVLFFKADDDTTAFRTCKHKNLGSHILILYLVENKSFFFYSHTFKITPFIIARSFIWLS